jgi:hypothetical protein
LNIAFIVIVRVVSGSNSECGPVTIFLSLSEQMPGSYLNIGHDGSFKRFSNLTIYCYFSSDDVCHYSCRSPLNNYFTFGIYAYVNKSRIITLERDGSETTYRHTHNQRFLDGIWDP